MIFISIDDFFAQVEGLSPLTRQEERTCAQQMKNGDEEARRQLIEGYLPMVASHIRHTSPRMQKLGLVTECVCALEKAVDSFVFLQTGEPFSHRLSWILRQTVIRYSVK